MKERMKPVRVASEKEFERLLDHMTREADRVSDHWHLLKGLEVANKRYAFEMNESQASWSFTLLAHRDTAVFRLARLYDQHDCSLSLKRFLLTIKAGKETFSQEAFRKRLKDNPYVEGLFRSLNPATLRADIRRVSEEHDPLVARLCKLRNQSLAHVDPNPIRLGTTSSLPWLKLQEMGTLIKRARRILTRYSLTYRASLTSSKVMGADDYNHLLDLVRRGRSSVG
jgi:hypothetical protein